MNRLRPNSNKLGWLILLVVLVSLGAGTETMPRPSAYAPLDDVLGQIELYVNHIETDLEDEAEYTEYHQDRIAKSANTLLALAQVLANHDDESPRKAMAGKLVTAAREVTRNTREFAATRDASVQLRAALQSESDEKVSWDPVADLPELMKQVPVVNNRLRSGVNGSRFSRLLDQNAGHAATLAAIAQASLFDTNYCIDEEGEALWKEICAEMRDAAAATGAAVRRKDQEAAQAGLARLVETCDRCHHAFRD